MQGGSEGILGIQKAVRRKQRSLILVVNERENEEGKESEREVFLGARGSKEITPTSSVMPVPLSGVKINQVSVFNASKCG